MLQGALRNFKISRISNKMFKAGKCFSPYFDCLGIPKAHLKLPHFAFIHVFVHSQMQSNIVSAASLILHFLSMERWKVQMARNEAKCKRIFEHFCVPNAHPLFMRHATSRIKKYDCQAVNMLQQQYVYSTNIDKRTILFSTLSHTHIETDGNKYAQSTQ